MHVLFTESWNNFYTFFFFHICNLNLFILQYYESEYKVGTSWAQLLQQF